MNGVPASEERRIRASQTARVVAVVLVVVVLLTFALLNTDDTRVDWLVGDGEAPLIVVIAVSAALGAVLGGLMVWRRRH